MLLPRELKVAPACGVVFGVPATLRRQDPGEFWMEHFQHALSAALDMTVTSRCSTKRSTPSTASFHRVALSHRSCSAGHLS